MLNTGVPRRVIRTNRTSQLLQMEGNRTPKEKYLHNFTYSGQELTVNEARKIISKYHDDDGSVDLDEGINGIAKVCLNNPLTKNAFNGKVC